MKLKIISAALLLASVAFAQEARIIIVEKEDSAELKSAYKDFKESQKRWEKKKAEVAKKYTLEDGKTIQGWEHVSFSADFRALVPANSQYASNYYYGGGTWPVGTIPAVNTFSNTLTGSSSLNSLTVSPTGNLTTAGDMDVHGNVLVADDIVQNLKTKEK